MIFCDTHTHIYLNHFDNDRDEVINRCITTGVKKLFVPDIDSETRDKMFEVSEKYPNIILPMLGLHPTSVNLDYQNEITQIKQLLETKKVYAIGECGLDYYWDTKYKSEQKSALVEQFNLAHKYNLPLVIHSRKSLHDIITLLKEYESFSLKGVFHCYPGGINEANYLIKKGFYIGVGGVVTYKNSTLAEVVKAIPLEHILLETDSPFLPPVPYRGKRNESSFLIHIAQKVAELKQVSLEKVAETTTLNAEKLFNIKIL
jgi:TatD DNase family protein